VSSPDFSDVLWFWCLQLTENTKSGGNSNGCPCN
jgi:hypothetical protein